MVFLLHSTCRVKQNILTTNRAPFRPEGLRPRLLSLFLLRPANKPPRSAITFKFLSFIFKYSILVYDLIETTLLYFFQ